MNRKCHYRLQGNLYPSQMNLVHICQFFFEVHFNILSFTSAASLHWYRGLVYEVYDCLLRNTLENSILSYTACHQNCCSAHTNSIMRFKLTGRKRRGSGIKILGQTCATVCFVMGCCVFVVLLHDTCKDFFLFFFYSWLIYNPWRPFTEPSTCSWQ